MMQWQRFSNPLSNVNWDRKPFRVPDESVESKDHGDYAIWYGPAGDEGDVATEVTPEYGGWEIAEYRDVSWLDAEAGIEGDDPFLKISTRVTLDELEGALGRPVPEDSALASRLAAGYGVAYLGYYGGTEERVKELPR